MSNSLASVHPELIPEWSERNLPLTPDKITFGSNKRVLHGFVCKTLREEGKEINLTSRKKKLSSL